MMIILKQPSSKHFSEHLWTNVKIMNRQHQKINRRYKENPDRNFTTEKCNNWNFKRNLVDKLNSKMEVTEEQISDTEDNNRNYPVYNKDNVD